MAVSGTLNSYGSIAIIFSTNGDKVERDSPLHRSSMRSGDAASVSLSVVSVSGPRFTISTRRVMKASLSKFIDLHALLTKYSWMYTIQNKAARYCFSKHKAICFHNMREKILYPPCEAVSFVRDDSKPTAATCLVALLPFCGLNDHRTCTRTPRCGMKLAVVSLLLRCSIET